MRNPSSRLVAAPALAVAALAARLLSSPASAQTPAASSKVATPSVAPATQPAAQTLVDAAIIRAAAHKKAVLVVFHASWCGWCHKLDKVLLDDPAMGKLLSEQYEIVHIDVQENGEQKKIENPGGEALMTKWKGSGLPFFAFLDAKGTKIDDSNVEADKTNIGYPGSPAEIAAFEELLKKTAPNLSDADRARLIAQLKKNAA